MRNNNFLAFTKEMRKDYTILVPNMLPIHFKLLLSVMQTYGLKTELLEITGPEIAENGLKYTHNDTCYPAILVIGQFITALESGKYDPNKTALMMFQTGGGCRASNYIALIRKALKKAGYENIPVISFSLNGVEKHPGFQLNPRMLFGFMASIFYGDLMMSLVNQIKPYEKERGAAERLAAEWTEKLARELGSHGKVSPRLVKQNYRRIVADFEKIEVEEKDTVKVGVVGEIFVKYSPLANNNLEDFLISEGAEVVVPGLWDFIVYPVYTSLLDFKVLRMHALLHPFKLFAYKFCCKRKREISDALTASGRFEGLTPFEDIVKRASEVISTTVKMGEGWLLPAEMLELADSGCTNIVCTQPFGCLPNHICGKGMMRPVKDLIPTANIVAIDYDAGASRVNQENRLKLMLSNAKRIQKKEKEKAASQTI